MNFEEFLKDLRAAIEHDTELPLHKPPALRQCPECGGDLALIIGRNSQKYFYTHLGALNCCYMSSFRAVKFETREAAEQAETIFRAHGEYGVNQKETQP